MKKLTLLFVLTLCLCLPSTAQTVTQGQQIPQGAVVYSLPQTCLRLTAQAQCTQFAVGPYAKYARKFLGIDVAQENKTTYSLTRIEMIPFLEADPKQMYVATLTSKNAEPWFLQLTSQGLVLLADSYAGKQQSWRFPSQSQDPEISDAGIIENLRQEHTTLYRAQVEGGSVSQIPVQQSQLVEKTLEQRAEEAAQNIFLLRNQRLAIITGDTDATFSGEALGAAVEEMRRMEDEYLTLFVGATTVTTQTIVTDVVPDGEKTKYVAFRLSDTQGLLPSTNVSGRPIVLDLSDSGEKAPTVTLAESKGAVRLFYRQPAVKVVRLTDGQQELLQARIPIYQMGSVLNFTIN